MFRGIGTGNQGQGPLGLGLVSGTGAGPGGVCVCRSCNYEEPHVTGTPCLAKSCPKCGVRLVRKM